MSRQTTDSYCQCTLSRVQVEPNTIVRTVSWIPTKYARLGGTISLKNNNIWTDWLVEAVGKPKDAHLVEEQERAYLHHREFSDI